LLLDILLDILVLLKPRPQMLRIWFDARIDSHQPLQSTMRRLQYMAFASLV
jgi:hypothetical protein